MRNEIAGILSLLLLQGCVATPSWVEEESGKVDAKAEQALAQLAQLQLERRLVLEQGEGAAFASNSAALAEPAKREIDGFLSDLRGDLGEGQRTIFLVAGHTDGVGSEDYNYELGQRRADSVARYLIAGKKLDPTRVVTVSYGMSAPSAENSTTEGRGKNRRVEILVYREGISWTPTQAGAPAEPSKAPRGPSHQAAAVLARDGGEHE
ncbi:MAG: OmpA family protein [Deltaproteobacteria bacterium]|nr:OmpA family protein [Deltaproteobacteria bacterium]